MINYDLTPIFPIITKITAIFVTWGGNQDVPIRNLTINHEPVSELHPSFDKDFKIDTSGLQRNRRASVDHIFGNPLHEDPPSSYKGGVPEPRRPRAASVQPIPAASPKEKPGLLKRIKHFIFGHTVKDNQPAPIPSPSDQEKSRAPIAESSKYNGSRDESPPRNRSRDKSPRPNRPRDESPRPDRRRAKSPPKSPPLRVSKLPSCPDSVYCLNQGFRDHTEQYSHPCRFNELCRRQADEPHLNHQRHNVSRCPDDRDCSKKTDPVHRAKYRHTGLPDYLFPCRHQDTCYDRSPEHRIRFSHGEELPSIQKNKTLTPAHVGGASKPHVKPCKFGNDCRSKHDPQHTAQYSHPT